jgi:hypothetical protein
MEVLYPSLWTAFRKKEWGLCGPGPNQEALFLSVAKSNNDRVKYLSGASYFPHSEKVSKKFSKLPTKACITQQVVIDFSFKLPSRLIDLRNKY